jgi:flagellar protein FliS
VNSDVAKYLNQQVMTASPAKLVYMLYDRAISSLREAIAAIEAGEIEARWKANNRALDILEHMWSTLDLEKGAEIGDNLNKLFPYMMMRLPDVDLQNDPAPAQEVIVLLQPLRDAWREIAMKGPDAGPGTVAPKSAKTSTPAAPPGMAERTIISA